MVSRHPRHLKLKMHFSVASVMTCVLLLASANAAAFPNGDFTVVEKRNEKLGSRCNLQSGTLQLQCSMNDLAVMRLPIQFVVVS